MPEERGRSVTAYDYPENLWEYMLESRYTNPSHTELQACCCASEGRTESDEAMSDVAGTGLRMGKRTPIREPEAETGEARVRAATV